MAMAYPTSPKRPRSPQGPQTFKRPPRLPANENFREARNLSKRFRSAAGFGRFAGRALPWLGAAFVLYEAYEYFHRPASPGGYGGFEETWHGVNNPNYAGSLTAGRAGDALWPDSGLKAPSNYVLPGQASNPATTAGKFSVNNARRLLNGQWVRVWQFVEAYVQGPNSNNRFVWQGNNVWRRITPDVSTPGLPFPAKLPDVSPLTVPLNEPLPSVLPAIDPFYFPPGLPRPEPRAIPYPLIPLRGPNPYRSPTEQTQRGNNEKDNNKDWSDPIKPVIPDTATETWFPPITIAPGAAPSPAANPRLALRHNLKRVGPNEKEQKVRVSGVGAILSVVNTVTEAVDFVDAIYKALPERYKPRYKNTKYVLRHPTPQQKLKAIYDNYDKIDLADAVENVIVENIEDYIWGRIGRVNAEASKKVFTRAPVGLQSATGRLAGYGVRLF